MAFSENQALDPCRDSPSNFSESQALDPCRGRFTATAFGFDDPSHADTGTRATAANWTVTPLEACR